MEKMISLLVVLMMALGCGFAAHQTSESRDTAGYTITEPYVYPILPGSEEWRNFESVYEMIDACQLPEDVVRQMTTAALAKTVVDSPMLPDILASDDHRRGFKGACDNINGLQELTQRADAWHYLGQEYLKMVQSGDRLLEEIVLVILLEQPEFNGPLFGWTQWGGEDRLLTARAAEGVQHVYAYVEELRRKITEKDGVSECSLKLKAFGETN